MTIVNQAPKLARNLSLVVVVVLILCAIKTFACYPDTPGNYTSYPRLESSGVHAGSNDITGRTINLIYGHSADSWADYGVGVVTTYRDPVTLTAYPMDFDFYYDPIWGMKTNPDYCWETRFDDNFSTGPGAKSVSFSGSDGNETHGLSFIDCTIDAPGSNDTEDILVGASINLVDLSLVGTNLDIEPFDGQAANIATIRANATPQSVPGGYYYSWQVPLDYLGYGIYVPINLLIYYEGGFHTDLGGSDIDEIQVVAMGNKTTSDYVGVTLLFASDPDMEDPWGDAINVKFLAENMSLNVTCDATIMAVFIPTGFSTNGDGIKGRVVAIDFGTGCETTRDWNVSGSAIDNTLSQNNDAGLYIITNEIEVTPDSGQSSVTISLEKDCGGTGGCEDSVTLNFGNSGAGSSNGSCASGNCGGTSCSTGQSEEAVTDYAKTGVGMDFAFSREYGSKENKNTVLGFGWDSNWGRRLFMNDRDGDRIVDAVDAYPNMNEPYLPIPPEIDPDDDNDGVLDVDDPCPTLPMFPRMEQYPRNQLRYMARNQFKTRNYMVHPVQTSRISNGFVVDRTIYYYSGSGPGVEYFQDSSTDDYVTPVGETNKLFVDGWGTTNCTVTIRQANGAKEVYYGFHSAPKLTDGRLKYVEDVEGHQIQLYYDTFGRIDYFEDTLGDIIYCEYYDDEDDAFSEKANKLKQLVDEDDNILVEYDYDGLGNLVSVVRNGQETRYEYNQNSGDPSLWHNLTKVYNPHEVAEDPEDPVAAKTIEYYESGARLDRVKSIKYGKLEGNGDLITGYEDTYDYLFPGDTGFSDLGETGVNKAWMVNIHKKEFNGDVFEETRTYLNYFGYVLKTDRYDSSQTVAYSTSKTYDINGRVTSSTNEADATGESAYLDILESAYGGLGQYLQDKVTSSTQGCNCGGGGASDLVQLYSYEPLTGAVRTHTDESGNVTVKYFDYQESTNTTTVLTALANKMGLDGSSSTDRGYVSSLLTFCGVQLGLGDLNGDGITTQYNGNVVKEVLPSVTLDANSNQYLYEGDTSQDRIRYYAYNSDSQLVFEKDEEGNKTEYVYYTTAGYEGLLQEKNADTLSATGRDNGENPTPVNARWKYTYDSRGNMLTETDPRGVRTDYQYDSNDQLIQVTQSAAIDGTYTLSPAESAAFPLQAYQFISKTYYDENGQVVREEIEDPAEMTGSGEWIVATSEYDILGRKTKDSRMLDSSSTLTTQYYYDGAGRQVLTVYPEGNADYTEYDFFGRVYQTIRGVDELTTAQSDKIINCPTLSYTYNDHPIVTTYAYDSDGQLWKVYQGEATSMLYTEYDYDAYGRRTEQIQHPSGTYTQSVYDASNGRLTDVKQRDSSDNILQHTNYVYDNIGRQIQVNRLVEGPGSVSSGRTLTIDDGTLDGKPVGDTWIGSRTEYDRLGRTTFQIDDNENITETLYDGMGRVISTIDPLGNVTNNYYDDAGNLIESVRTEVSTLAGTNDEVFRSTYYYDSLGRLLCQMDNDGKASDYRYNSRGQMVAVSDPKGPLTPTRTLYRRGDTSTGVPVNQSGNVTLFEYDALGRKTDETQLLTASGDGSGDIGRNYFGEPTTLPTLDTTQGGGDGKIDTTYEYDDNSRLLNLIDDNGNKTTWTYDAQNRKIVECKGNAVSPQLADRIDSATNTSWSYDALGRLYTMTKEDGSVFAYSYNTNGQLSSIAITRATGVGGTTAQAFTYDILGRRITATDNNDPSISTDDTTVSWAYDTLGRVVEEGLRIGTSGPWHYTSYDYAAEQRSSMVYPNGRQLDYAYNDGGQLAVVDDHGAAGDPIAAYDTIGGRVLRRAMENGIDLDYRDGSGTLYDAAGRPDALYHRDTNTAGSPVAVGYYQTYDRAGNKLTQAPVHDGLDDQIYGYESASRLIAFDRTDENSDPLPVVVPDDEASATPSVNGWTAYSGAPATQTIEYVTDATRGNVLQVKSNSPTTQCSYYLGDNPWNSVNPYDDNFASTDKVVSMWVHNNTAYSTTIGIYVTTNISNRLVYLVFSDGDPIAHAAPSTSYTVPVGLAYRQNQWMYLEVDLDEKIKQINPDEYIKKVEGIWVRSYDISVDDITLSMGLGEAVWALDGVGNWSQTEHTVASEPVTVERLTTSFNEYYSVGGVGQAHDSNGNLMDDGLHTFTWDAFNRMTTASDNSGLIVTYLYDATNRRVAKVFPEGSSFADVQYAYSNWQVLGEYEDGMTYPSRQFVYGVYIDEPLVMDVNADASGSGNTTCIGAEDARYFYHAGQIYSVAALSDADGDIVEGWRYDPYGRHVRLTDGDSDGAVEFDATDLRAPLTASALGNPYTFTGRRFDPETQLHHYRNRYYDSRRGRFISRDPIGFSDGMNMYQYSGDNPLAYSDFLGLMKWHAATRLPEWNMDDDDNYFWSKQREGWETSIYTRAHSLVMGGALANYPEASRALLFYLLGQYSPFDRRFDFDGMKMLRDDEVARGDMVNRLVEAANWASFNNPPGGWFVGENDPPNAKKDGPLNTGGSRDWYSAVGGWFAKAGARVDCHSGGRKSMVINLFMGDRYNFHDNGNDFTVGGITITTDKAMEHLQATGYANAYHREGGWIQVSTDDVKSLRSEPNARKAIEKAIQYNSGGGGGGRHWWNWQR